MDTCKCILQPVNSQRSIVLTQAAQILLCQTPSAQNTSERRSFIYSFMLKDPYQSKDVKAFVRDEMKMYVSEIH